MRGRRALIVICALLLAAVTAALLVDVAEDLAGRVRAADGDAAEGVVVDRYQSRRGWTPELTVEYAVDGRRYVEGFDAERDVGDRVVVRHVPGDPQVSRLQDAGTGAYVEHGGTLVVLLLAAPFFVRDTARGLRTARPARARRPRTHEVTPAPPLPPAPPASPGTVRRRVLRGAAAGGAVGVLAWTALAAALGAGPPREVASALLGLAGPAAAFGALAGLLASAGALRRAGRGPALWAGAAVLLAAVPLLAVVALAVEGS